MEVWHRSRRLLLMWRCRQPRSRSWFCFHRRRSRGWSTLGLDRMRISWSRGRTPKILILSTFGAWRFCARRIGSVLLDFSRFRLCWAIISMLGSRRRPGILVSFSEGLPSGKQQGLGNRTRLLRVRKGRSDLESESLQSQVNVIYPYFWKGVGSCGPWVSRTSFLVPTLL
jgi:hypothetical protein